MTTAATVGENLPSNPTTTAAIRPVKVMHVITDLDVGGAERMLVSYLTAERSLAPNSFVVSLLSGGYFAKWLRQSGLSVHEMKMGRAVGNLLSLFRIALMIRREKPDVRGTATVPRPRIARRQERQTGIRTFHGQAAQSDSAW